MAQLLNVTSEINVCDCCGKSNLLFTVAIQFGTPKRPNIRYYGSDCAGAALGFSVQSRRAWVRKDR